MNQLKYTQIAPRRFRLSGNALFALGCAIALGAPSALAALVAYALT